MNRRIVVSMFMAAIFLILAFSPIANDATSIQYSIVANSTTPQADLTSSALKSTSNPVHLDKYTYHKNII